MYNRLKSWAVALALPSLFCVTVAQRTPSISFITQDQIKNVGDTVELECSTVGVPYTKNYMVQWMKIDQYPLDVVFISTGISVLVEDSRFAMLYDPSSSSYIVQIKDIQETDAGIYQCQIVLTVMRSIKANSTLQVRSPAIISDYSNQTLVSSEGEAVVMSCNASGSPTPQITWHRDNNATMPTGGASYTGDVLEINWVRKEDIGTYYCVADNGVGESDKRAFNLKVEYSPVVTVPKRRLFQAFHYDIDLQCHIDAYPLPTVAWMKDGMDLSNDQNYSISLLETDNGLIISTLRVVGIEEHQYGEYFCQANNKIGQNEAKVELIETYTPVWTPTNITYYGDAARSLSVSSFLLMATVLAVLL